MDRIAVDCEGVNLSRDGPLTLLQIGTPKAVYLFDISTLKKQYGDAFVTPLRTVLESRTIVKVMHDCRRDGEALYYQCNINLRAVRDTQLLYAMLVSAQQTWSVRANAAIEQEIDHEMRRIGLNRLLQNANLPINKQKDRVVALMTHNERFWEIRYFICAQSASMYYV